MSTDDRLERLLAEVLDSGTPVRPPDRLEPETLRALRHVRRWPRWLALIKEPPMRLSSNLVAGSPTVRLMAIVASTLLLALMVAAAGVAGSRLLAADGAIVVDQDGNGTVTTIGEAVELADDGDLILVKPGTYDESVVITKDITIKGDGDRDDIVVELSVETPVGVSGNDPTLPLAFRLEEADATLENLTVRGESSRIVISGGTPVLRDLVIDGAGRVYGLDPGQPTPTGLDINDGSTATITKSVLTDTDVDIETGSAASFLDNEFSIGAIWMEGTGVTAIIRRNIIADSGKWGISVNAGASATIEGNTITNARVAVEVTKKGAFVAGGPSEAIVHDNTISDSQTGISVRGSDATATENVIQGEGRDGVSLSSGGSLILDGNTIEGYEVGLLIVSGSTPILTGNKICDNGTNVQLFNGAEMPDTSGNEICEDAPDTSG